MQIVLQRIKEDDYQTLGELKVYNNQGLIFECKTLELPWVNNERRVSRIPSDHYQIIKHQSPKFGNTLWVQDVLDRSEILIHRGNYKKDTLGCILVGERFIDLDGDGHRDVTNSGKTMKKLYSLIEEPAYLNLLDIA